MNYLNLLRIFDEPILASPSLVEPYIAYLKNPTATDFKGTAEPVNSSEQNGIGILELSGTFVPRLDSMQAMCGNFINTNEAKLKFLDLASKHDTVLLVMDSPGGSITGIPEFADAIKNSKAKTIVYSETTIASAAYWIASAADEIVVTSSAVVGSIGVYLALPKAEDDGTVYFSAGDKKLYGRNPDMSDDEKTFFQEKVNKTYDWFTSSVAENRATDLEKIVGTQAETFNGKDASPLLVDRIVNNIWEV